MNAGPGAGQPPGHWLQQQVHQQAQAMALVLPDGALDYATLQSLTAQLCHVLRGHGLRAGAILVVESRSTALLALLLHAALYGDFILLPLDPRLPEGQRERLLEQVHADILIVDEDNEYYTPGMNAVTATDLLAQAVQAKPVFPLESPVTGDRCRLLLATSGSSGIPKLVTLADDNLEASVDAANERLGVTSHCVWLDCLSLAHIGGLAILLRCARQGASVVLHEGFDAHAVMQDLHKHNVSHISLVPAMLARLLDLNTEPPPSLQVALIGGAPLDPGLAQRALDKGWPVWVTYGMTETASMVTARRLQSAQDDPRQVGAALRGFDLRLVDDVIQVRGAAVCRDAGQPRGQWLSTGDRGQLDAAGQLTILGRKDEMLLSGGEKVHPEAVERLLVRCPGVDRVAVTGQPDPVWGEKVVAVYCGDIDEASLAQLCRDGIKGALRPRAFLKVDALPLTTSGKLDRAALKRLVADRL